VPSAVLDASALLALLLDEAGAPAVRLMLADAAMSTVNLAEVVGQYARHGAPPKRVEEVLANLPIEYFPLDSPLAYEVGLMLPMTLSAGLSLGDRACLALARRLSVPALTADRRWAEIAETTNIEVKLIR
jgi:ribonuclease VapC